MVKVIVENTNSACFEGFMREGRLIEELPFINSLIFEIDEKKLKKLKQLNCHIKISEETGVTAQIENAKKKG
ncbi:MAG: hypothetical protein LUD77_05905 [Clostridiales bacterium]|nr:hypothetical protein [Clostridiales bacterium]